MRLADNIGKAQIAAYTIKQFYDHPSKHDFKNIITGLKKNSIPLQGDQVAIMGNCIELHSIHKRTKRSLIPIVGKCLSFLFGTATESEQDNTHKC